MAFRIGGRIHQRSEAEIAECILNFVQQRGRKLCSCLDWRQLTDHPGYYICEHGTILSARGTRIRILKPFYNEKTRVSSASFGKFTKGVAKLVLESFDPNFLEKGGTIRYLNHNRRDVRLGNLSYETHSSSDEKDFWNSYKKLRWDSPQGPLVRTFFGTLLDEDLVSDHRQKLKAGVTPTQEELQKLMEKGWDRNPALRGHYICERAFPEGMMKELVSYLRESVPVQSRADQEQELKLENTY